MSGVMRFIDNSGLKTFYFDSSPAASISAKIACSDKKFELRNKRDIRERTMWDVYSISMTEDEEKTPLRKVGTLEYQKPQWPGGPPKEWPIL